MIPGAIDSPAPSMRMRNIWDGSILSPDTNLKVVPRSEQIPWAVENSVAAIIPKTKPSGLFLPRAA